MIGRPANPVAQSFKRTGNRFSERAAILPPSTDRRAAECPPFRRDIAELIANGQPLTTSGDNLVVELDISAANLPAGARLRVGEAVVEVTPKAHNGCQKFAGRFGHDALRFVQEPATRHHNLRGIYWKIVSAGEVSVGARIEVLSREAGFDSLSAAICRDGEIGK